VRNIEEQGGTARCTDSDCRGP